MARTVKIMIVTIVLALFPLLRGAACAGAAEERPVVAYSGVFLMGNKLTQSKFPVYLRNQKTLTDAVRVELKKANSGGKLPFSLIFDTDMEAVKGHIGSSLSLAFIVVRDDVVSESFRSASATVNKTVINAGLTAILYSTSKNGTGGDRNTVLFSFPLVGYSQRLDGNKRCSPAEIDALFVDTALATIRDHLVQRLAGVVISDIFGSVTGSNPGSATIDLGSTSGIEEGQNVFFLQGSQQVASGSVIVIEKKHAVVRLAQDFHPETGMRVRSTNMRAESEETYQVVDVRVSSKKAAGIFSQEEVAPQLAQWFSNFLTERGGKVVLPSRVGGDWDQRATGEAFKLLDQGGAEHIFELPPPKYPVQMDLTGVTSKVTDSGDVNDICMFKVWLKLSIPAQNYQKEFDLHSSKSLIKGVQSYVEKDELFELLYQLTARMAKEAQI